MVIKIWRSIESANLRELLRFLRSGFDPDDVLTTSGDTALHLCAAYPRESDAIQMLIALLVHGANPNKPNCRGNTCVHVAAERGYCAVLNLLLTNGGRPQMFNGSGCSAIDIAHINGHFEASAFLRSFLNRQLDLKGTRNLRKKRNFKSTFWKYAFIEIPSTEVTKEHRYISEYCTISEVRNLSLEEYCKDSVEPHNQSLVQNNNKVCIGFENSDDAKTQTVAPFPSMELNYSICGNSTNSLTSAASFNEVLDTAFCLNDASAFGFSLEVKYNFSDTQDAPKCAVDRFNKRNDKSDFEGQKNDNKFEEAESDCSYKTALSIVEEHLFEDKDMKLLVRKCMGSTSFTMLNDKEMEVEKSSEIRIGETRQEISIFGQFTESLTKQIKDMSRDKLRIALEAAGHCPGPITTQTVALYRRLLQRTELKPTGNQEPASLPFSRELQKVLDNLNCLNLNKCRSLQMQLKNWKPPTRTLKERNSVCKYYFVYLLLDPRITMDLPLRSHLLSPEKQFHTFIRSVFYIGKGRNSRPFHHFKEALQSKCSVEKKKILKIRDIWQEGFGVVSLQVFQNILEAEAYIREAAMIEAIGKSNLCNQINGTFSGPSLTWSSSERRLFGVYLLHSACAIMMLEGERQIRPSSINV